MASRSATDLAEGPARRSISIGNSFQAGGGEPGGTNAAESMAGLTIEGGCTSRTRHNRNRFRWSWLWPTPDAAFSRDDKERKLFLPLFFDQRPVERGSALGDRETVFWWTTMPLSRIEDKRAGGRAIHRGSSHGAPSASADSDVKKPPTCFRRGEGRLLKDRGAIPDCWTMKPFDPPKHWPVCWDR